jgi:type II secretory pathway component PulF
MPPTFGRRLDQQYHALADALGSGLPPDRAMSLLAGGTASSVSPGAASLRRGEPIVAAIRAELPVPPADVPILQAAEESGRLPETLRMLAADATARSQARRKFLAAAAYPLFVLHVVVPAASASKLLTDPAGFSTAVISSYVVLWVVLGLAIAAVRKAPGSPRLARRVVAIPVVGTALRSAAATRFLRTLWIAYSAGLRIDRALALATGAVGVGLRERGFATAARLARDGESIERSLAELSELDRFDRSELVTAATAGELEPTLARVVARSSERWSDSVNRAAHVAARTIYFLAFVATAFAVFRFWSGYFDRLTIPR